MQPDVKHENVIVLADACVLITLIDANELRKLVSIKHYDFCVTEDVVTEIIRPQQKKILAAAISDDVLSKITIDIPDELAMFAELQTLKLGRGEASSIAVAYHRGWSFATDEKGKCRKMAEQHLGHKRILTTTQLRALWLSKG